MAHYLEHKLFEPAFYSTVIQDWGTSVLCAMELGERAKSLVDLGHQRIPPLGRDFLDQVRTVH